MHARALEPYYSKDACRFQIWTALRNEMVIAPSAFGVVGGEELQAKRALAARCGVTWKSFHINPSAPKKGEIKL